MLRAALERLLSLLLDAARGLFLMQGVALGCASAALLAWAPADLPDWLRSAALSALLLSGTCFVAGLAMGALRGGRAAATRGGGAPAWPWPPLLGASLLALPALSAVAASGLPPLWSEIAARLDAVGLWTMPAASAQFSGPVLVPIFLALLVPALVTAAALYSIAFPLALLPLLAARSRRLPTLLATGVACQTALVLAGWLAADAFGRLAERVLAEMAASGDAEVLRIAGELDRATGLLGRTALALVAPAIGMLAWAWFLRPAGAAAAFFTASGSAACEATRAASGSAVREATTASIAASPPTSTSAPVPGRRAARHAPRALAALGALMLAFAAADRLRARPVYARSQPAPGATLTDAPTSVRVAFDAELDPASSLSITRLVVSPSTGPADRALLPEDVEVVSRLSPTDPERRTLEAAPSRLASGLYRVAWQALPARGGVARHGSFSFGVGVRVPEDAPGTTHSLQDRDAGTRGRRHAMLGGALLLALGLLLPRLSPRP